MGGDLDDVHEGVLELHRPACSDGEGNGNVSAGVLGLNRPGCGGGEGDGGVGVGSGVLWRHRLTCGRD